MKVKRGQSAEVQLHVRNFRPQPQAHRIEIHAPAGITAQPAVLAGSIPAASRAAFPLRLTAGSDAPAGVGIVALDVSLDGRRYGEWFEFIVLVEP